MRHVYELETLTAWELRRLVDSGVSTVVVPFGSVEHQDDHLPLGADALLADAVGREVARRLGAVVAPTTRVGCSEGHAHRPGTLTLHPTTLTAVAAEHAHSLARQGFTTIALVSTHGGNYPALDAAVAELERPLAGTVICAPRGDVGPDPGAHSGAWLTSVMLALRPDLVDLDNASGDLADEVHTANAQRGHEHIDRFVASIVASVQDARTSQ